MAVWPLPRITFRALSAVQETRRVALLTSGAAWSALSGDLALPILIQAEPARYDRELFDYLAAHLPSRTEVVYAVGSGAPVEAGKLIAARNHVPLVIVPDALLSASMLLAEAQVEDRAGDRRKCRAPVEAVPADEILIDWDVIGAAPDNLRGAGIVDVIAIVTGLLDWRYAAQKSKNPREQRFVPWAAGVATDLAKQAIKGASTIGQGDPDALRTLLDLMMMTVQLSNQLGHRRVQQGSEHYLANIVAATTGSDAPHAEIVAPCLLFCAALHGQDPSPLSEALTAAGVRLDQVRATDFNLIVDNLATHLGDYAWPYSILNDLDPFSETVAQALDASGLAILRETWEMPDITEATQPVTLESPSEAPHTNKILAPTESAANADAEPTVETGDTHPAEGTANMTVQP